MKQLLPLILLLSLTACQKPDTTPDAIRPALVWTIGDQADHASSAYSGEIKARYEADLSFRVGGKLTKRKVEPGDHVKAHQVLAQLDTADLRLGMASAQATLSAAEADYTNAEAELARVSSLHRKQFIGQAALDAAQASRDAAAARVVSAKAQTRLSGNQTAYTELKADRSGIITTIYAETGQVVSTGTPIVHIAYDGEREVHIRVGENTAQNLRTDTAVNVHLWAQAGSDLQGKVREVSPATDATRSFLAKISLLNPPNDLRLGLTADVTLPTTHAEQVEWLPAGALFQQGKQTAVWVLDTNHQVNIQPVTVLSYHENGMTVSGLSNGTQVIAAGVHKLSHGQTVAPIPYNSKLGL